MSISWFYLGSSDGKQDIPVLHSFLPWKIGNSAKLLFSRSVLLTYYFFFVLDKDCTYYKTNSLTFQYIHRSLLYNTNVVPFVTFQSFGADEKKNPTFVIIFICSFLTLQKWYPVILFYKIIFLQMHLLKILMTFQVNNNRNKSISSGRDLCGFFFKNTFSAYFLTSTVV